MGIKQHLVALAGIGEQHEGAARAQLHVRHLQAPPHPGDDQPFLAPVELEGLPQLKLERHEGTPERLAATPAPVPDKVGHQRVAARIPLGLEFGQQRAGAAPVALGASGVVSRAVTSIASKAASLPGRRARRYLGSLPCGFLSQALMVLRDRLVRREISDRDSPSRKYILRILPNVAMVITLPSPAQKVSR
jgi:hypothetical protein